MLRLQTFARTLLRQEWWPDLRDLHIYGGLACLAYGASILLPAAGWLVTGLLLLYLGLRV